MNITRRGLFGVLATAPVVAPVIAKPNPQGLRVRFAQVNFYMRDRALCADILHRMARRRGWTIYDVDGKFLFPCYSDAGLVMAAVEGLIHPEGISPNDIARGWPVIDVNLETAQW